VNSLTGESTYDRPTAPAAETAEAAQPASTKEAMDKLPERRNREAELRKKLEESQAELDEMDAELEENREKGSDFSSDGEPTPLARDVALHDQNSLSELEQLLRAERVSTTDAMDKLREAETEKRNFQKKFEQLKSSMAGQMSFMRKKLEEKYQAELDEVDAELEESREEGNALRMQIQSLTEHI
jgi:hypothetical protein